MNILTTTTQVARKSYLCDACCLWDNSGYGERDVTPEQWKVVEAAKANNWKIKKGDKYLKQTYVDDGQIRFYRARIDMHDLCLELEFFDD